MTMTADRNINRFHSKRHSSITRKTNNQGGDLLLGRVVDKGNALLDVALQALNRGLQESLLLVGNALQRILDLLDTVGLLT